MNAAMVAFSGQTGMLVELDFGENGKLEVRESGVSIQLPGHSETGYEIPWSRAMPVLIALERSQQEANTITSLLEACEAVLVDAKRTISPDVRDKLERAIGRARGRT